MDSSSNLPVNKSPRKDLQGPRPTPLKVRKDSHKIRKPPVAPQNSSQQQPPRLPVIIYAVSPKVIHTHPSEFMNLVQRLTGSSPSSSSSSSSSSSAACAASKPSNDACGAVSLAGRCAIVEKANNNNKSPEGKKEVSDLGYLEEIGGGDVLMTERRRMRSGFSSVLSPGSDSLQPISPNMFSGPSDPNYSIGSFYNDLSPKIIHGNSSFTIPSPSQSSFVSPHHLTTPPSLDLFNHFFDL